MNKRQVLIFEHSYTLTNHMYKRWIEIANESIRQNNRFTVILSGGRTPIEFYSKLSNFNEFDVWRKTHIFWADERFVSFEDTQSNYKMIKDNLLNYIDIPEENIHPIFTDRENVDIAAAKYESKIKEFFGQPLPRFDFALLGIGEDGHTASLFPHEKEINERQRLVVPVSSNALKTERITLTLPIINNTRHIYFIALSAIKAEIIKTIIEDKIDYPATRVNSVDGKLTFLLDREAASKLSYHDAYTHVGEAIALTND